MEKLLHYVWKHRLYHSGGLCTTDGRKVEVIDPGLPNAHAGPDFFNAKVKIGGTLWAGNVEIHDKASDWDAHGHHRDKAYDSVVLHVVAEADAQPTDTRGRPVPQMLLGVPPSVAANYRELLATDTYPPCYRIIPELPPMTVTSWLAALQAERLEQKTEAISRRAAMKAGAWEEAYFATLARNFGFGINGDAFEQWAMSVPLGAAAHHRDDPFQVEALFMGQAGLLQDEAISPRHRAEAAADGYLQRLRTEYAYLARKFGLSPIDCKLWRFLRLRPQNFPHIRIAQMATLYHEGRTGLGLLLECRGIDDVRRLLATHVSAYWQTHYSFGSESAPSHKCLSGQSINLLAINTAIPVLFAYGRHTMDEGLCQRAFGLLESLKPENNAIIRTWRECGLNAKTAADSQALLQLKRAYCDRRDCLRCRFGYEYLKRREVKGQGSRAK